MSDDKDDFKYKNLIMAAFLIVIVLLFAKCTIDISDTVSGFLEEHQIFDRIEGDAE